MHNVELLQTLVGGLTVALIFGYITQRLGLSPIVGYLIGGIAIGPFTPGFAADRKSAEQLAEVGVILLMFGVGLQFHLDELLAVRRVALPGALLQSSVATVLGAVLAHQFGWTWSAGIIFGLALSVASTVVLTRVLADHRDLHTPAGHIAIGWLVVQDLFMALVLVVLPALFGEERGSAFRVGLALFLALANLAALMALTLVAGGRYIPQLLEKVAVTGSRELFTLTVLVVALGIAFGAARVFGVSMALGAFLAGMVVGRSEFSLRAAAEALPMRDAFAVLFFVSIGMLLDPIALWANLNLAAWALGIVVVVNPLVALVIVLLLRYPTKVAFSLAMSLGQIGEFSFILATLGKQLGILTDVATNVLVTVAITSISINPLLYRLVDPAEALLTRFPRLWRWLNRGPAAAVGATNDLEPKFRSVVVGYGPVGRTVTRLLVENEIVPTVIEFNLDTVRQLQAEGTAAVYGDAAQRTTLEAAGVAHAGSLILSSAGMHGSAETIRIARELNPAIRVLARTAYVREIAGLQKAGARAVFAAEAEVAIALTAELLRRLGATPEQIDRERVRVRGELLGHGTAADVAVSTMLNPRLPRRGE